jgi:predicted HicB family RNase H-like nuclease
LTRKALPPESAPPPAVKPAKKVADDGKMTTSLRIDPEKLEALKIIALRERVRVNELVIRGIDHIIALHKQSQAA